MNGRRSHRRFAIASSAEAVLRVLRDVILERADGDEIAVISRDAGVVGEHQTLEIVGMDSRLTYGVRVVESRPVVVDGNVRHRLRLEELVTAVDRIGTLGAIFGTLGVLMREFHVRVVNCSASGCLVESHVRLDLGTVLALRLFINGRAFTDDVQVVRCRPIEGAGSLSHIGLRYLWSAPPGEDSLRLATQHLVGVGADEIRLSH